MLKMICCIVWTKYGCSGRWILFSRKVCYSKLILKNEHQGRISRIRRIIISRYLVSCRKHSIFESTTSWSPCLRKYAITTFKVFKIIMTVIFVIFKLNNIIYIHFRFHKLYLSSFDINHPYKIFSCTYLYSSHFSRLTK